MPLTKTNNGRKPLEEDDEDGPYARMMAHEDDSDQVHPISEKKPDRPVSRTEKRETNPANEEDDYDPYLHMMAHDNDDEKTVVHPPAGKEKQERTSSGVPIIRNAEKEDGPYAHMIAHGDDNEKPKLAKQKGVDTQKKEDREDREEKGRAEKDRDEKARADAVSNKRRLSADSAAIAGRTKNK